MTRETTGFDYGEPVIPQRPPVDYEAVIADLRRQRDTLNGLIQALEGTVVDGKWPNGAAVKVEPVTPC